MSRFKKLLKKALTEDSPPGFKGTVKAMKKHGDVDNPYALGWWMKNKGYKSHKKATGADKNEAVGDSSGMDSLYNTLKVAAERYIKVGLTPEKVEAHAKQMRPKFDTSADYEMAVASIMRRLMGQAPTDETLGGGKATDVSLTDARGSTGMAGHLEGETSGYVATTDFQALAGDQARGDDPDTDLKLPGVDDEFSEETGDNWSTTDGPGATGMSSWVSTDAFPDNALQYDMDLTKLPESFDFSVLESGERVEGPKGGGKTLASTKGIKRVGVDNDDDGKKIKFMHEPSEAPRPDYRALGAKDVKDAENLSDEAINKTMRNSAYETIRIDHVTKGKGTVLEIGEKHIVVDWDKSALRILGPERLPLSETKYLSRIKERYTDDPDDVEVEKQTKPKGKKKMAKKKQKVKVDEAWMAAIKSTMRDTSDGYKLPTIDLNPEDIGLISEYDMPDPGDSVLTGDQAGSENIAPLSTERGADAAHDDIYPDGDYGKDLVPSDAPGVPSYDEMGDDAGNSRSVDGSDQPAAELGSSSAGKSSDVKAEKTEFDGSGPTKKGDNDDRSSDDTDDYKKADSDDDDDSDDDEDKDMKEGLTWKDIGLNISEVAGSMSDHDITVEDEGCYEECGGMEMSETHDTGAGEIAMDAALIKKLLVAIRDQSPDDAKMDMICSGLAEASREKAETLAAGDIGMIMDKIRSAAEGGDMVSAEVDVEVDPDNEMAGPEEDSPSSIGGSDSEMGEEEGNEDGDVRGRSQGRRSRDGQGARDDRHNQKASKYTGKSWAHEGDEEDEDEDEDGDEEYEDKAAGDGEEAGPEGGEEHEGKTKLMDKKGKRGEDDDDRKRSAQRSKSRRGARAEKKSRRYAEGKGESSLTNYGGDNKRKSEKGNSGTPIGSKTGSGPGGGNTSNGGQSPLIPEVPDGTQLGADGTPISKEGGGKTVDPISESMVAIGMAGIGSTVRNFNTHSDDGLTDDEKELRAIKRRAGLENWWK